jgi:hypothetical protein
MCVSSKFPGWSESQKWSYRMLYNWICYLYFWDSDEIYENAYKRRRLMRDSIFCPYIRLEEDKKKSESV